MNITSRSKYALRAVIHLARTRNNSARREDLAVAQGGISAEYLEKILLQLREKNIVSAKTGPGGGYRLAKSAASLTAWEVISAVEGSPAPVACLANRSRPCGEGCEAMPFWKRVWDAARNEMQQTSIASLADGTDTIENFGDFCKAKPLIQCR
jgi:Rrf2 family protein